MIEATETCNQGNDQSCKDFFGIRQTQSTCCMYIEVLDVPPKFNSTYYIARNEAIV